jgi:hypothetical protein
MKQLSILALLIIPLSLFGQQITSPTTSTFQIGTSIYQKGEYSIRQNDPKVSIYNNVNPTVTIVSNAPYTQFTDNTATPFASFAALITYLNANIFASSGVPAANPVFTGSFTVDGDLTPTQVTANQNNYNPTGTGLGSVSTLRVSTDAQRNFTGLIAGVDGQEITWYNIGSFNHAIICNSTSSTALNRILFPIAASQTYIIRPAASAKFKYDGTSGRWRFLGEMYPGDGNSGITTDANGQPMIGGNVSNKTLSMSLVQGATLNLAGLSAFSDNDDDIGFSFGATDFSNGEDVSLIGDLKNMPGSGGLGITGMVIYDSRATPKGLQTFGNNYVTDPNSYADKRYVDARMLTLTGIRDFPSTAAGAVSDLTISSVTGAEVGDACIVGVPNGSVTATATYWCWVSATNTVTIRFSPKATEDPASGTFRVTVYKAP